MLTIEYQTAIQGKILGSKEAFYQDLQTLLKIPSVKTAALPGAPFGQGNQQVLAQIVTLGKAYGFQTKVVADALAYVQIGEDDDDYIGIVGHLDVVAATGKWSYPPFDLSLANGRLYGRGILDNKGPIFACLYGLKLLQEMALPLNKTLRIIFGTDEESGSSDIPLYLATEKAPSFAFTPDCKYPVVYGERGIIRLEIKTPLNESGLSLIAEIRGDQSPSFVPDFLETTVFKQLVVGKGRRSPSNSPETGSNAITDLAERISQLPSENSELTDYFQWLVEAFKEKHYGEGLNLALADQASGSLIVTPFELRKEEKEMSLGISIRYPVSYKEEEVLNRLKTALPPGSHLNILRSYPSLLVDKNKPEIQQLTKVYEEVMGVSAPPVTTTGATYARAMPNTVAFGPSFPGQKGIAHNVDEYMDEKDLLKNMEIYMQAMLALCQ